VRSNYLHLLSEGSEGRRGRLTSNLANAVTNAVNHLLANGVVATSVCLRSAFAYPLRASGRTVVGRIFLAADQQLGVEQLAVGTGPDLVDRLPPSAIVEWHSTMSKLCIQSWSGTRLTYLVPTLTVHKLLTGDCRRTEGSKSTKIERGTYFPLPVSVKKVSKEPPSDRCDASGSGRPSALRPCSSRYLGFSCQFVYEVCGRSRAYSSQAALPS
jgi:hypothetical protein